jgi:uncharacterized protein (TIGR00255 family)
MKSMTGFGIARGKVGRSHILVETRSVNHRFCEVNLRFPGRFASLEPEVTRLIRQLFARGKFDLFLREEATTREDEEVTLAKKSYQLLKKIRNEVGIKDEISLAELLSFRQIFSPQGSHDKFETMHGPMLKMVRKALSGLEQMREREGARLRKWFQLKNRQLLKILTVIEKNSHRRGKDYRHRLERKLKGVGGGVEKGGAQEERVIQEAAMMAERSDVTEEIVRLRSHLQEFEKLLSSKEPLGRKLDFLAQEMGREINTIGSKSQGVELAHQVIEFKSEMERVREQVQNIE